jgi:queuine tRNA-ribosyltransferase
VSHLFRSEELLGLRLASIHNLRFIGNLMRDIRTAILDGTFPSFREGFLSNYKTTDEQTRVEQKGRWLKGRGNQVP